MEFVFWSYEGPSRLVFHQKVQAGLPYVLISVRFARWDKRPALSGRGTLQSEYLAGKWSLWIYPVSSERKAGARELLMSHGLPSLVTWLCQERAESWYWGRKRCDLIFHGAEETLRVRDLVEAS